MERKKQWIWAAAGACALLLAALVAILVLLRARPEMQPLETLEQHFRPREEAFASMGMPGYLMTEPEEIAAFFAENGIAASAEAVLTTPNDALTGIQTASRERAEELAAVLRKMPGCAEATTRANLVFYSCAARYSYLALDRLEQTETGWYLLGEEGWTLVLYRGGARAELPEYVDGLPLARIGWRAFAGSGVTSVHIPSQVTEIGDYAFYTCTDLTDVQFAEGCVLARVGGEAFGYCTGLASLALPGAQRVEAFAFRECTLLAEAVFTRPVDYLGEGAFYSCNALSSVSISGAYCFEDGALYNADKSVLLFYPQTATAAEFELPAGVRRIGYGAFLDNMHLTRVRAQGLEELGGEAFHSCGRLAEVSGMGQVKRIGFRAFFGCGKLERADFPAVVDQRGEEAFYGCAGLPLLPEAA